MMNVKGVWQPFIGKQIKDVFDQITKVAHQRGLSVNIIDPEFNVSNIDYNPTRMNVHVDSNSIITGFVFG